MLPFSVPKANTLPVYDKQLPSAETETGYITCSCDMAAGYNDISSTPNPVLCSEENIIRLD